ncbi:unnamed protein product [Sphagnum jensenii]|uniref:Uncharacterized protein n=1 Tax=Sphagnum jensenii TaxID=128206 RepID=A0ABP0WZM6_9BRYO
MSIAITTVDGSLLHSFLPSLPEISSPNAQHIHQQEAAQLLHFNHELMMQTFHLLHFNGTENKENPGQLASEFSTCYHEHGF